MEEDMVPASDFFDHDPFEDYTHGQGGYTDDEDNRSLNNTPNPADAEIAWHRREKYKQNLARQNVREQGNRYF